MLIPKSICLTLLSLFFLFSAKGQEYKETLYEYFAAINTVIATEDLGNSVVYRLDSLKSTFIPSRSYIEDYFDRDIEFGFKHRRILLSLNFSEFQVDLFCRNDTIFSSSVKSLAYESIKYSRLEKETIDQFLAQRNKFYCSYKTPQQLIKELSRSEQYAFYCGDGMPKTRKGEYIERLVDAKNTTLLIEMLKSLHCETQAYGLCGLEMLAERGYRNSDEIQQLIDHIKKRNSALVICMGCLAGLVKKIYTEE